MKKVLLIVVFLIILIAIPLTVFLIKQRQEIRQRAAQASSLYIEPAQKTVNPGEEFTVEVKIDTDTNYVVGVELYVTFSSSYLEALSIVNAGTDLPELQQTGQVGSGVASISVGSPNNNAFNGSGTVAVVRFKALQSTATPTVIDIGSQSIITSLDDPTRNVLLSRQKGEVTITGGSTASPGPSATPAGSPAASASPGPSATPGSSPSPSPSNSAVTTTITSPASGATVSNRRPTITGTSFASALIVVTLSGVTQDSPVNANSNGNWSYTPSSDLADGTYTVTVTATDPNSGIPETIESSFTVSAGGTGGTTTASPSPSPSASTTTTTTTTTKGGESTDSAIPVTGTTENTLILLMLALGLVTFGGVSLLRKS